MTDEELYNAMAESMNQDAQETTSNPCLDVELPERSRVAMVDATPESIAKQIVGLYTDRFGCP